MSEERQHFDQGVTNLLQQFRTLDPQYPKLVADMKKTVQTMYTAYATSTQRQQARKTRLAKLAKENEELREELVALVSFRGQYQDTLAATLSSLKALLADPQLIATEEGATDLRKSLETVAESHQDNAAWQQKVHRLYTENTELRDRMELLEEDCHNLSDSIDVLKRELCGRIQQVQMFSQGLADNSNAAYTRLLSEMQQNTMKAMAQAEARRKRHHERQSLLLGPTEHEDGTTRVAANKEGRASTRRGSERFERTVTLTRGDRGLGMRIQGGKTAEGHQMPVFVDTIYPGTPTEMEGTIFVGDIIKQINGVSVEGLSHEDIIATFKESGDAVTLLIDSPVNLEDPKLQRRKALQRAVQCLKTSNFEEAVAQFDTILETVTTSPIVYAYRASGHLALGHLDTAEADCKAALDIKVIPLPLYILSRICESRGQLHQAARLAEFACSLDPTSASLSMHRAHVRALIKQKRASVDNDAKRAAFLAMEAPNTLQRTPSTASTTASQASAPRKYSGTAVDGNGTSQATFTAASQNITPSHTSRADTKRSATAPSYLPQALFTPISLQDMQEVDDDDALFAL